MPSVFYVSSCTVLRCACSCLVYVLSGDLCCFVLDKVIVHEWGHLRWGLFEEYPIGTDIKQNFYYSTTTNSLEPSRCTVNVKGRNRNRRTGAPCKIDPVTSFPESDCRFYPTPTMAKKQASLMYEQFLQSVSTTYIHVS